MLPRVCKPLPWAPRGLRPGSAGEGPHGICFSEKPLWFCGVVVMGREERPGAAGEAGSITQVRDTGQKLGQELEDGLDAHPGGIQEGAGVGWGVGRGRPAVPGCQGIC